MSYYKIGQFVGSKDGTYSDAAYARIGTKSTTKSFHLDGQYCEDNILVPISSTDTENSDITFDTQKTYYLKFSLARPATTAVTKTDMYFHLKMIKKEDSTFPTEDKSITYQYLKKISLLKDEDTKTYEILFTPLVADLAGLWIEMVRTNDDIDTTGATGAVGRKVEMTLSSFSIVKDLLDESGEFIQETPLAHIGVWGADGTLLAINGEQIEIGPRQRYELENIDIDTLGIINKGNDFIIDYQYKAEE